MAKANLNKSKKISTSDTTASKYIPKRPRICINWNSAFFYFTFRLSGSGKELQFGGRARYSKSPELIETTFSMSTIAEEDQQELSSKSGAAIDA